MDRVFCEVCGHPTLRRVSVHVDQDGQVTYYEGTRPVNTKGTRVRLPRRTLSIGSCKAKC